MCCFNLILPSFYQWGSWKPRKANGLSDITQLDTADANLDSNLCIMTVRVRSGITGQFVCLWRYLSVNKQYLSKYNPTLIPISSQTLLLVSRGMVCSVYSKEMLERKICLLLKFPNQSHNFLEKIISLDKTVATRCKWKYVIWSDTVVWKNTY